MIEILNVSKKFRIWEDRSRDLKETAINFLKGKRRSYRDLWALRGINVEIKEGETVAFIGENGSGKSTLLKLLCSIYAPDEGKIITNGKISALLELGVGFHPDLTGEENIYLNGAMLGFDRKKMKKKFDEIVSFSEIGDFIYSPIRTYSSGMAMRLGFSVAMCVDPDILLIDEVLAVGDEAFQQKCLRRLDEFKFVGKTIIIVTHGLEMVRKFCERAILLHAGEVIVDGEPDQAVEAYHTLLCHLRPGTEFEPELKREEAKGLMVEERIDVEEIAVGDLSISDSSGPEIGISGKGEVQTVEEQPPQEEVVVEEVSAEAQPLPQPPRIAIREMTILDSEGLEREFFDPGETVRIKIIVETQYEEEPAIGIGIVRDDLSPVYGVSTLMDHVRPLKIGDRLYSILIEFPSLVLLPGKYIVRGHSGSLGCSDV